MKVFRNRAGTAVWLGTLLLSGCAPRHVRNWDQLHKGMSPEEVRSALGAPSSTLGNPDRRFHVDQWYYGAAPDVVGRRIPVATPSDVFVVHFGPDGRVAWYRRPFVATGERPKR